MKTKNMSLSRNLRNQMEPMWGLGAPFVILLALLFFQSNSAANADSLTVTGGTISMDVSTNGASFPSGIWASNGKVGIGTTTPAYTLTVVGNTRTDSVILKVSGDSCYQLAVDAEGVITRTHVSCTNGTIIGHTVTANGNAAINTVTSKIGGASGYFPDSSDYLSMPDGSDWDFGTGNFTIEGWVYVTSSSTNGTIASQGQSDLSFNVSTYGGSNPGAYFAVSFDGTTWAYANYTTSLSTNQWHHLALVRNGNQFTGYADGVGTNLINSASAVHNSAASLIIGAQNGASLYGYLDEVRISKEIARYTSNFTPPTNPFSCQDANATLLLHMDSSTVFTDSSGC